MSFWDKYHIAIIVTLSGVLLAVFLNWAVGKLSSSRLLESLQAELKALEEKQKTSKLTIEEENQMQYLKGEIYILKFKCS